MQILVAAGVYDHLHVRLDAEPFSHLRYIGSFEHHFRSDAHGAGIDLCLSSTRTQPRVSKGDTERVVTTLRNQPLVRQSSIEIKSNKIMIRRLISYATEPAETLVGFLSSGRDTLAALAVLNILAVFGGSGGVFSRFGTKHLIEDEVETVISTHEVVVIGLKL